MFCECGSSGWPGRGAGAARGVSGSLWGGPICGRGQSPPCTPTLPQVCCLLNPIGFVPDRAVREEPVFAAQSSNEVGVVLWFWGRWVRWRAALPIREFWCFFGGGEAKADFTPKTESAETHRVLSFLPRESGKRIAISRLASAGRVGSAYYCGELKLSKRHIER